MPGACRWAGDRIVGVGSSRVAWEVEMQSLQDRPLHAVGLRSGPIFVLTVAVVVLGCGTTPSTVVKPPPDTSALRGITRYYQTAAGQLGRPPKQMSELRAVVATLTDEPDKYLRSTRDGEEFVVVWG